MLFQDNRDLPFGAAHHGGASSWHTGAIERPTSMPVEDTMVAIEIVGCGHGVGLRCSRRFKA